MNARQAAVWEVLRPFSLNRVEVSGREEDADDEPVATTTSNILLYFPSPAAGFIVADGGHFNYRLKRD